MFLWFIWMIPFLLFMFFPKALSDSILKHSHSMNFGRFYDWEDCPINSYANGFEIKVDREEKSFSDEEGMTGLRLRCSNKQNEKVNLISSYSTQDGNWRGMETCSPGEWLTGFRIQIQGYGWWIKDDTAANDIEMVCNYYEIKYGHGNDKGKWTEWNQCERGEVICGIRTKVEDVFTADRVGVVAVHFRCCPLDFNRVPPTNRTELWTSIATTRTPILNRFTPIYFPRGEADPSSSSTRSQYSELTDSQAPGVTRPGHSDSSDSLFSDVTKSRTSESTDFQLFDVTRSQSSDSTDSPFPGVTRSEQSDSTDSQLFGVTRSRSSDTTDFQLSSVTRSQFSDLTESQSSDSSNSQFPVSTESQLSDFTENQQSISSTHQSSELFYAQSSSSTGPLAPDSREPRQRFGPKNSQSSVSPSSEYSSLDSINTQFSVSTESQSSYRSESLSPFSTKFSYSTESQSSGSSSSVSNEFGLSKSTESSSVSTGFRPSDYSSIILGSIFTTTKPGNSTQREIIFPNSNPSWELSSTETPRDETNDNSVEFTEKTNNPSSVSYGTTNANIGGFSNEPISTSSPNGTTLDEKSKQVTPVGETFTANNFNGVQNENKGNSRTTASANDGSVFNNRNNGSDKTSETERTTMAVDVSIYGIPSSFGSSTLPPSVTTTNWKTSSKPFTTTTNSDDVNSFGLKPPSVYEDHGSENETKTEDDEYVPFGLTPVDEKNEDRNSLHPRIFPTKSPPNIPDTNNSNNTDTTEINLNDILFPTKKNESKTFFGNPLNDTDEPRIEGAEEGTAYHDFWSQSEKKKSNTDPNLAIFVMLGLAVTAAVALSLLGLGYYIKKRKRKMSIDPRYKYVISVRQVKPIDPIASE